MLSEVIEYWHFESGFESRATRFERMHDVLEGAHENGVAEGQYGGARRSRGAGFERLAQRRKRETLPCKFAEQPQTGERAHQSVQRLFIRAGCFCNLCDTSRALRQVVCQLKLRRRIHQ